MDAIDAACDGGGRYETFDSREEAEDFVQATQREAEAPDPTSGTATLEAYVVWVGYSTGIMTRQQCIDATRGVFAPKMKGPLPPAAAFKLWLKKQASAVTVPRPGIVDLSGSPTLASAAPATDVTPPALEPSVDRTTPPPKKCAENKIEKPSMGVLKAAMLAGKKTAFGCIVDIKTKHVRIALSFEAASRDVTGASVRVFGKHTSLLENYMDAEDWATQELVVVKEKSMKDMLREARARRNRIRSGKAPAKTAHPATGKSNAKSGAGRELSYSQRVRTREAAQITRYFVDDDRPIRIAGEREEPEEDDLDIDLPLPGAATYRAKRAFSSHREALENFMEQQTREHRATAWPLMSFSTYMAFCKHASRLCQRSEKPAAVANAAAFAELEHIIVKDYRRMEQMGSLGQGQIRFKALGYIRLQHMSMDRCLYVGTSAKRMFYEAIDPLVAGLPASAKSATVVTRSKTTSYDRSIRGIGLTRKEPKNPVSGCFLCDASDHYASDKKFHPWKNGKRPKVAADMKQRIMKRIADSDLTAAQKTHELKVVKAYWSQYDL